MKNYIFFALAAIVFSASICFIAEHEYIQQDLIIVSALGVLFTSFLYMAGLRKEDFRERIYKKVIREKKEEVKYLQIMNVHLAQSSNDFFNALNSKNKEAQNTLQTINTLQLIRDSGIDFKTISDKNGLIVGITGKEKFALEIKDATQIIPTLHNFVVKYHPDSKYIQDYYCVKPINKLKIERNNLFNLLVKYECGVCGWKGLSDDCTISEDKKHLKCPKCNEVAKRYS
jgi:hypothetical protein